MRRYLEDLALWGVNALYTQFLASINFNDDFEKDPMAVLFMDNYAEKEYDMKKQIRFCCCLVVAAASLAADASFATDIYLLLGQSNMAGRGVLTSSNRVSTVRVMKFRNGREWCPATEPIVEDGSPAAGACLGAQFGREMADADSEAVIGLIPAAVGNTKLARWEPDGDLYRRAVEWTRKALAHGGKVKGMLWHQGEADAGDEQEVATYAARLEAMVAALRKEFGDVPFVAGELGPFLDTLGDISERKGGKRSCRLWKDVNAQLRKAVREIPNAALVSADGLADKGDHLHFSTAALRVLGHRYAEELRRLAQAELPPLFGDGVHDDTAAIQARLDAGKGLVHLPPPAKEYLISTTLVIRSSTELRLDRFTRVRLAPQSDCSMLTNARWTEGDRDIAVSGGIWDFDNVNQPANRWIVPRPGPSPKIFEFEKVEGLTLRGITFRNPVWYNCQLRCVSHFTVEDITFVQDKWNPKPINMDGINIHGGSHHGRVANLRGTCFDDMVALNAHDPKAPYGPLPITDIDVDGLYSDFTHRGVRIYSCGRQPVKRVTVRNVHIKTYRNAVAITNFRPNEGPGVFDDIAIRDVQSSMTNEPDGTWHDPVAWPLVWVENNCEVGHLVIDNVCRTETWRAAHPTIGIDPKATVEHLVISNCRQVNETKDDLVFLVNRGKVGNLELGTVSLKSAPGAGRSILRDDTAACGRIFPNFTPNVRPKGMTGIATGD